MWNVVPMIYIFDSRKIRSGAGFGMWVALFEIPPSRPLVQLKTKANFRFIPRCGWISFTYCNQSRIPRVHVRPSLVSRCPRPLAHPNAIQLLRSQLTHSVCN